MAEPGIGDNEGVPALFAFVARGDAADTVDEEEDTATFATVGKLSDRNPFFAPAADEPFVPAGLLVGAIGCRFFPSAPAPAPAPKLASLRRGPDELNKMVSDDVNCVRDSDNQLPMGATLP